MTRAFCLIRDQPIYRKDAFVQGLRAAGFTVSDRLPQKIEYSDVLLIWNRYAENHELACRFERAGANVLVAENAYLGVNRLDRQLYAISHSAHNGAGCWRVGAEDRFGRLGVVLEPWRAASVPVGDANRHVLVAPNRSFGMPGMIMHPDWPERTVAAMRAMTSRPIRLRPHPGNDPPKRPLLLDLENCWCVVIWSSSAGVEALARGIPVICMAPHWICRSAASTNLRLVENPPHDDESRLRAMRTMAWAQWTVEEIRAGVPFMHLFGSPVVLAGGAPAPLRA